MNRAAAKVSGHATSFSRIEVVAHRLRVNISCLKPFDIASCHFLVGSLVNAVDEMKANFSMRRSAIQISGILLLSEKGELCKYLDFSSDP